jgi:uncharacterized coiled-coil protein SlyX
MDEWKQLMETRVNNLETRVALAERDIEGINKKLDKIDAGLSRLTWIVISAVVLAIVQQVLI